MVTLAAQRAGSPTYSAESSSVGTTSSTRSFQAGGCFGSSTRERSVSGGS
jgi:hypothetical protein